MKDEAVKEIELDQEELRQLQLIQLEILIELDRICKKHKIDYSIDGGTLLGAVRHGGFIPWDDDIDVIMLRSDYERFYEICKTELDTENFFLQEHRTDPHYRVSFARLLREGTIYIRQGQEKRLHRTGVPIDIFALNNIPDQKASRLFLRFCYFALRKILWSETGKVISKNALLRLWYTLLSWIPERFIFSCYGALSRVKQGGKTELLRHTTVYPNNKSCAYGIPSDLMDTFTSLEFEGHKFMAVSDYDRYLTLLYGDYMELPPLEKRTAHIKLAAFENLG